MSRKGSCWDNVLTESFVHTINVELIQRKVYGTFQEIRKTIFDYIKIFYNQKLSHSCLDYLSPAGLEKTNED
jgi:putative transposase